MVVKDTVCINKKYPRIFMKGSFELAYVIVIEPVYIKLHYSKNLSVIIRYCGHSAPIVRPG